MEYNRQALGEEREVVVGRENGKFVSHGHRANQENGFSPFDEIRSGNEVEPPENGALASCSASPSAILWR
jgi:hypothetical protein